MRVEIKQLTKIFGDRIVLNRLDCTLENGIYGLLGQNGAGKTTFLRILLKLISDFSGEVNIDGKSIRMQKDAYFSRIGYLPQSPRFYDHFTAFEMLRYLGTLKGMAKREIDEKSEKLLKMMNLSNFSKRKVGTFSGGMKQRLGICQALLNDPELLIFDEPTAGLDPIERTNFRNVVAALSKEKIILISTHIVEDLSAIANEILVLHDGIITVSGTPNALLETIRGKTFEKKITDFEYENVIRDTAQISTVIANEDGYTVRYLSEDKNSGKPVSPSMEEVFLFYCKRGRDHDDSTGLF